MRPTNLIVLHCSASSDADDLHRGKPGAPNFLTPAMVIDQWHSERGFRRSAHWRQRLNPGLKAIGYHYVIGRTGQVETGRHVDEIGAHARGHNLQSVGICLVGHGAYAQAQWAALATLVTAEVARIAGRPASALTPAAAVRLAAEHRIDICGHRDLPDVNKACPCFDVAAWLGRNMEAPV